MTNINKLKTVFTKIDMQATKCMPHMDTPCWPFKGALAKNGRPYVQIDGKKYLVYRLTYELVHGLGSLDGYIARHKCDNEICGRPDHIEKGSHEDNMSDMKQRERHGLPHHAVRAIRKLATQGRTHQEIADLYGIARSTVTMIVSGDNYSHVEGDNDEVSSDPTST